MTTTETTTSDTQVTDTAPEAAPNLGELSFQDYERVRRGEKLPVKEEAKPHSAPAAETQVEQKKSEESETSETEEQGEGETLDRESLEDTEPKAESAKEEKKTPKGIEKRFKKMTADKMAALQRAEAAEQRLRELEARMQQPTLETTKTTPAATESEPQPEQFETHKEYVKAVAKWEAKQERKEWEAEAERKRIRSEQEKVAQTYQERLAKFKANTPDFAEVDAEVTAALHDANLREPSPAVVQFLLNAENGPELAYKLGKDPEEFVRICKLNPFNAAIELGKFAAKFEATSSETKKTEPTKITQAPKPIEPVGAAKGTVRKSVYDPDLPFSDYERMRREQMRRKRA